MLKRKRVKKMEVKLVTADGIVKGVTINCSPVEYIVVNKALKHYSDINAVDALKAEKMVEEAEAIYSEEVSE